MAFLGVPFDYNRSIHDSLYYAPIYLLSAIPMKNTKMPVRN